MKSKQILGIVVLVVVLMQLPISVATASAITTNQAGEQPKMNVLILMQDKEDWPEIKDWLGNNVKPYLPIQDQDIQIGEFEWRMRLDPVFNITYATEKNFTNLLGMLSNYHAIIVNSFLPDDSLGTANTTAFITELNTTVHDDSVGLFFLGGYYPVLGEAAGVTVKNMLPVIFEGGDVFSVEEETYVGGSNYSQPWVGQIELMMNDEIRYDESNPAHHNSYHLLQRNVVWESSPLVRERLHVRDAKPGAKVLVYRPEALRTIDTQSAFNFGKGTPLVVYDDHGSGRVLFLSMTVGGILANFNKYITVGIGPFWNRTAIPEEEVMEFEDHNRPFYLWPYFNFFIYQSTMFLGQNYYAEQEVIDWWQDTDLGFFDGRGGWKDHPSYTGTPEPAYVIHQYSTWVYSPIPHISEATAWMIFVAGLWVFNFVLFFTLGRKKRKGRQSESVEGEKPEGETSDDESREESMNEEDTETTDDSNDTIEEEEESA